MKRNKLVLNHEVTSSRSATRIGPCIVLSLGIGLLGCATGAPPATVDTSTSALTCEPFDDSYCDPNYDCDVGTPYVQCGDGIIMDAWMTPDCRWCINRDVCDGHGDLTVCPF